MMFALANSSRSIVLFGILCILVGIILIGHGLRTSIAGGLMSYSLLPVRESFTELYFDNHTDLPSQLRIGRERTASFTIRNRESSHTTYRYHVVRIDPQGITPLKNGVIPLNPGEFGRIPFRYSVTTVEAESIIEVTIPDTNQSIRFRLNSNSTQNNGT